MASIGFLGAGNMGQGMVIRLLQAGHQVSVYNRSQAKLDSLVDHGAIRARTPKAAAERVDAVISMVGDDQASHAVWLGADGVLSGPLKAGVIAIECSTLSRDWVLTLSQAIKSKNIAYLDCPVTGFPDMALAGELTLLMGGDTETISAAQPYLTALSTNQIRFGEIGAGTAYKLIVNLMGSIQILALAEGLRTAECAGLDLQQVCLALSSGAAGSPIVVRNSQLMVAGDHEKNVTFSAHWRLKDTQYGVEFANKVGLNTALGTATQNAFQELVNAGHTDCSESKIIDMLRN